MLCSPKSITAQMAREVTGLYAALLPGEFHQVDFFFSSPFFSRRRRPASGSFPSVRGWMSFVPPFPQGGGVMLPSLPPHELMLSTLETLQWTFIWITSKQLTDVFAPSSPQLHPIMQRHGCEYEPTPMVMIWCYVPLEAAAWKKLCVSHCTHIMPMNTCIIILAQQPLVHLYLTWNCTSLYLYYSMT